ncbi:MAG TPA: hypothetical protein VGI86_12150 [Acidimicrobiia bacterium]
MLPSLRPSHSLRAVAIGLIVVAAAACGSSSSNNAKAAGPTTTTYPAVIKVGPDPSVSSKMVCGTDGQAVIAAALNETPTKVTTPTWANDLYSCTYVYKAGTMGIAVKELTTRAATTAYFNSLKQQYGMKESFQLAQGAFVSPHSIVVVRKDYKVLTVDPTKLPSKFGQPPTTLDNVAVQSAVALMGCWTGA